MSLRVERLPAGRLPAAHESAAYRLVLDAVSCAERAGDGRAVRTPSGDCLVGLPGVSPVEASAALMHAADRFAALGGEPTVAADADGAVVTASAPR